MGIFTAIDLSRLPAPAVVELLDFDTVYGEMLARLQALLPGFDATVESDPAVKVLQVAAYREVLLRQRVNDAARAVMPAYALGTDLDNLAAAYGVKRLVLVAADPDATPPVPELLESDDDFRRRLVLAPEGYSVAGPAGAYIFHALSAAADVLDASVDSPTPGQVVLTILSRQGSGVASAALLAAVTAYLATDRRPLTDQLVVQSAAIVDFTVAASIATYAGPDSAAVVANATTRLAAYLAEHRRLGHDITRSGINAALFAPGVQNVTLTQPAADVVVTSAQCARCTAVAVVPGPVAE